MGLSVRVSLRHLLVREVLWAPMGRTESLHQAGRVIVTRGACRIHSIRWGSEKEKGRSAEHSICVWGVAHLRNLCRDHGSEHVVQGHFPLVGGLLQPLDLPKGKLDVS